jgi:integrase
MQSHRYKWSDLFLKSIMSHWVLKLFYMLQSSHNENYNLHLTDVLKKVLRQRKIDTLKNGWGDVPEWIFVTEEGKPCYENYPRRIFYKVIGKAGLRKIRLHDLRHTYATLRITKGDNVADVSKQLGHHSVKFTMDIYYHWIPGGNKNEVDGLDDVDTSATIRTQIKIGYGVLTITY